MSLSRITKKPQLEYTPSEVINSAIQSIVNKPVITTDNITIINSLINEYNKELDSWTLLIDQANTQVFGISIPKNPTNSSADTYSNIDLQNWMNTGSTYWPNAIIKYEENAWDSPNTNIYQVLYGTLLETQNELISSVNNLTNTVQAGKILPDTATNINKKKLDNIQNLREQINQAIKDTNKQLESCVVQTFASHLQKVYDKKTSSNTLNNISSSRNDLTILIKSIRIAIRYSLINSKIDWASTRKNILKRFMQLSSEAILHEVVSAVSQIENSLVAPFQNTIVDTLEILNEQNCNAYSELVNIFLTQFYKIKHDAASKTLELEKEIDKRYSLKGQLVIFVSSKIQMDKTLSTLDLILQALDSILSSGRLDQQIINHVENQVKVNKKTIGPGDFPDNIYKTT